MLRAPHPGVGTDASGTTSVASRRPSGSYRSHEPQEFACTCVDAGLQSPFGPAGRPIPALNRMIAAAQTAPDADRDETAIEALLGRCAARDRAAFAELYQRAAPRLLACLLAILRRRDLAEDALQEVMVRIWQRSDQYDGYRGQIGRASCRDRVWSE